MFLQTLRLKTKSADNQPAKIALTSVSMAILMPLPALLLFLPGLDALRGHQDLAAEQNSSLWPWGGNCRTSKCSGRPVYLESEFVSVKNCQVKKNEILILGDNVLYTKENMFCEETCDVELKYPAQKVTDVLVRRRSGRGDQMCYLPRGGKKDLCQNKYCCAKCSGQKVMVPGDLGKDGKVTLTRCRVNSAFKVMGRKGMMCDEICDVKLNPAQSVPVRLQRESGFQRCQLRHDKNKGLSQKQSTAFNSPVEEIGMWFIEQIETRALKLVVDRKEKHLPLLKGDTVEAFLEKMQETMDQEMNKHGYSREITAEHVVIIGDLYGQLFTLIAFLNEIKEHYADKGFKTLDESSFLFCDPSIQYVFLGNYVQWGESSVEVPLLLLAYKARLAKSCDSGYKDRPYK